MRLGVGPAAQKRIARLLENNSPGRGVVSEPRSLSRVVGEGLNILRQLADPATPPNIRISLYKKTPWWPRFIEAAYRGELRKAKLQQGISRKARYGDTPSEIAEEKVAEAATISSAEVHALCQQVRDEAKAWEKRGGTSADDPEISAAELARHLANGPAELSKVRELK
jgi:hypothetical protein